MCVLTIGENKLTFNFHQHLINDPFTRQTFNKLEDYPVAVQVTSRIPMKFYLYFYFHNCVFFNFRNLFIE